MPDSKVIPSKWEGYCKKCKRRYGLGVRVFKSEALNSWIHETCPKDLLYSGEQPFGTQPVTSSNVQTGSILGALSGYSQPEAMVLDQTQVYEEREFTPSHFQQAIFDFIKLTLKELESLHYSGHAVVEAVAGSGKTTTIVKALQLIPLNAKAAFLAFNKHIASELKKRSPDHIYVSTIHSLGMSLIRRCYGEILVDDDKVGYMLEPMFPISKYRKTLDGKSDLLIGNKKVEIPPDERTRNRQARLTMRRLVSLSKATLVDYNNSTEVLRMCERFGIEAGEDWLSFLDLIDKLPEIMERCKTSSIIDFDDMVWLPVVDKRLALHSDKYDWLFVDEAQDLNACQIAFLKNCLRDNGRIIAVGDRRQSLYGFRGADVEAIPNMIRELNAVVLPLSISYRCPRKVVELAQAIVPGIEAASNAIEGSVEDMTWKVFLSSVVAGDMVICRTNAPLVAPAFAVIKSGRKAVIRGKDIGKALVNYIERFQAADLNTLEVNMVEATSREIQRYLDDGKELLADASQDRCDTIRTIAKECITVPDLIAKLELLFDDGNRGVIFSSIHKSKGLEANRVFILHKELMPHPKATQDWEVIQELNAVYVAQTRTKEFLYFVENEEE